MVQAQELVLTRVYRIPFSTNVERVALAAGHKGVAVDWIDVDPDDRSPVVAASGQELVPVLVHGDEVVADSPKILDWLEARVPEPPKFEGKRFASVEAALADGPKFFEQLMTAVGSRDGREVVRALDEVRQSAGLDRDAEGRYCIAGKQEKPGKESRKT